MAVFSCFFALRDGLLDGGLFDDRLFDDGFFNHGLFDHGLFDDVLTAACSLIWSSSIATWRLSLVSLAARCRPAKSHRPVPPRILRLDRFLFSAGPRLPLKRRKVSCYW